MRRRKSSRIDSMKDVEMDFFFWIMDQANDLYLVAFIVLLFSLVTSTALVIEELSNRD